LLKYFINNINPHKIETFADIRWSGINPNNTVYHKNGFQYTSKHHQIIGILKLINI
jgi:hypothetical protein